MRVDVHAHYYHATYVDRLARNGADTRPAVRAPGAGVTFDQRVGLLDSAGNPPPGVKRGRPAALLRQRRRGDGGSEIEQ